MNKEAGHEVRIIASTEVYNNEGHFIHTQEREYFNEDGILVKRLEYLDKIPSKIIHRIRIYKGLYDEIKCFAPDVILCHGIQSVDILKVKKYIKNNRNVTLYVDNHADFNNSAHNIISKILLHKIVYKAAIQLSLPYIEKVLFLTYESKMFLKKMYGIPDEKLEYYPLGGKIFSEKERIQFRRIRREELNIQESDILLIHSGKMQPAKKTEVLLSAFNKVQSESLKLVIIGNIEDNYSKQIMPLIKSDDRVKYIGWKTGQELQEYLCAGDIYVQPGSQSATMQNALCCGNAVILTPVEAHKFLLKDAGIYINNEEELIEVLKKISTDSEYLNDKKRECFKIAETMLDYKKLAERLVTGFK